jgi:hypothetical protein
MATGGTPSGKAFVFDAPRAGGYSSYAPTGYAAAYSQGKGIMEMIDWQDKKRREAMEEQIVQNREQRAERGEQLAEQRASRQDMLAELRAKREMEYNERQNKQQEDYDSRMDSLGKITSLIDDVDPLHKDAASMLDDIRHSQDYHSLIVNKDTGRSLSDAFKAKADEIKGIQQGIQHEAKSKYGIEADLSQFPIDEKGRYDFNKGYREYLPSMAEQANVSAQQTFESAPDKPGYTKYSELDVYGRPKTKFVKTEDVNKQKLEEQRLQRGGQLQALGAIQALRQEFNQTLGGFKQKDLRNPTGYLDENGKPTKDPANAAVAIWKAKGKEVARMPENERKVRIEKIGNISSSIEDYSKMAFPSSLPKTSSEATTSTQQPYEGMRVIQDGQTYEYRNGNYTPVE